MSSRNLWDSPRGHPNPSTDDAHSGIIARVAAVPAMEKRKSDVQVGLVPVMEQILEQGRRRLA